MYVPSLGYKEPHYARIQAQIMLNGTVQRAQNQDPILIYPNKQVTFIQTNQKIYKPGDKVKIRVLVLDHELTASNKHKVTLICWCRYFEIIVIINNSLLSRFQRLKLRIL